MKSFLTFLAIASIVAIALAGEVVPGDLGTSPCASSPIPISEVGTFTDGSAENTHYKNDVDKCFKVQPKHGFQLSFPRYAVEKGYDFARVFTLDGKSLGEVSPGAVFTGHEGFIVWFHTDYSNTAYGFTAKVAAIEDVDFDLHISSNMKACHTSKYRTDWLPLRRGCHPKITVKGTTSPVTQWKLNYKAGGEIIVPATHSAGVYTLQLDHKAAVGEASLVAKIGESEHVIETPIAVLFNPYSTKDTVYMSPDSLSEFIENETGAIYTGSKDNYGARPWNFDQFDGTNLKVAMLVLEDLSFEKRSSPIYVTRHLSAKGNVQDSDNGILHGKWSEPYDEGKKPWEWTGSTEILHQYYETKTGVKYGQCWVFSGLLTTLSRAVGIPSRSVTNFDSAHEGKPYDHKIDEHWTQKDDGSYSRDSQEDSIWNFHVWNEGWFTRPDISKAADGWNAYDSTPQEESQGKYQCGPASLNLMKSSERDSKYDADFIMGETSAKVIRYVRKGTTSPYKELHTDHCHVGSLTATRNKHGNGIDVKYLYKEKPAQCKVAPSSSFLEVGDESVSYDDRAEIFTPKDLTVSGGEINGRFRIKGLSSSGSKKLTIKVKVEAVMYTNKAVGEVGAFTEEITLKKKDEIIWIKFAEERYRQFLSKTDFFRITASAVEGDSEKPYALLTKSFRLRMPKLLMLGRTNLEVGHTVSVNMIFTNPLSVPIHNLKVQAQVSSSGFDESLTFTIPKLAARAKGHFPLKVKASSAGNMEIVATMSSEELVDVYGSAVVKVSAPSSK